MKGSTKLTVNVPTESMDELRHYSRAHGITMTEGIRQALGLLDFVDKEIQAGAKLLIEDRRGRYRQIMM